MTELVECNTQLHKTLQGLWSDALTQHKLQQQELQSDNIALPLPFTVSPTTHTTSIGLHFLAIQMLNFIEASSLGHTSVDFQEILDCGHYY